MKKILAIVLALCLALSLSLTAFAVNSPSPDSPTLPGNTPSQGVDPNNPSVGKLVYSCVTDDGRTLNVAVNDMDKAGEAYSKLKELGVTVLNATHIDLPDNVADGEIVHISFYTGELPDDAVLLVYDEWEILPEVTFVRNGARVTVTAPAGVLKKYPNIAFVTGFNVVDVENPQEEGTTGEESEDVGETPEVSAPEEEEPVETTPEVTAPETEEKNPGTGIALAVLPMVLSAAAAVVSKRR